MTDQLRPPAIDPDAPTVRFRIPTTRPTRRRRLWRYLVLVLAVILLFGGIGLANELKHEAAERQVSQTFTTTVSGLYECTMRLRSTFKIWATASNNVQTKVLAALATAIAEGNFGPDYVVPSESSDAGLAATRVIMRDATASNLQGDRLIAMLERNRDFQACHQQFAERSTDFLLSFSQLPTDPDSYDEHLAIRLNLETAASQTGLDAYHTMQLNPRDFVLSTYFGCQDGPPTGLFATDCR